VARRLLTWFDGNRRDLPWRRTRDPYRILVAECLLQRTRIASGMPYYERFLERFPDLPALASATEADVLRAWEGLGFYRRARNLHAAAREIIARHGGRIPDTVEALQALPGIGPYTAGAIASIAFDRPVPAVDGNAARVLTRLYRVEADVTKARGRDVLRSLAAELVPNHRPGDFNQALMELGARICTPMSPACPRCPLETLCLARSAGVQDRLPRASKPRKPRRVRVAFAWIPSGDRILLVRRVEGGLLGGLWSLPGGEIAPRGDAARALEWLVAAQTGARGKALETVAHLDQAFSHRRWSGEVRRCELLEAVRNPRDVRWATLEDVRSLPMVPSHRRVLESLRGRMP